MSTLRISWKLGKPFGILTILFGFSALSQIPIIYHAREILEVVELDYLAAYIVVTIAAFFVITNASTLLYESLLIRFRSYDIKDYRAPFLSVAIINVIYFICYYSGYAILNGIEVFKYQLPVFQYAFAQMLALLVIMVLALWYNKRQTTV